MSQVLFLFSFLAFYKLCALLDVFLTSHTYGYPRIILVNRNSISIVSADHYHLTFSAAIFCSRNSVWGHLLVKLSRNESLANLLAFGFPQYLPVLIKLRVPAEYV